MTTRAAPERLRHGERDRGGSPGPISGGLVILGEDTGFGDEDDLLQEDARFQPGPPTEVFPRSPVRLLAIDKNFVELVRLSIDGTCELSVEGITDTVGGGPFQNMTFAEGYRTVGGGLWAGGLCAVSSLYGPTRRIESVLGTYGLERILAFKKLERGWDCGRGEPLSVASLAALDSLLAANEWLRDVRPSVFLTASGNVQVEWSDSEGRACEIECFGNQYEYYFESRDSEGLVPLADASRFTSMIREAEAGA